MKNLFLVMLSMLMFSCINLPNVANGGNDSDKIKAKVIRITCATTTIQILDAAHFGLGETWTIQGTSNTYEHVAVVANKCEMPDSLKEGNEFNFQIINESEARNDCMVCMMYDFPPSKSIFLKVVN